MTNTDFNACLVTYCTCSYNGYGNPIDIVILLVGLHRQFSNYIEV